MPENKCPLCGKLNPITEWVCEDCGARLPLHGKGTSTPKQKQTSVEVTQVATPPTTSPTAGGGNCVQWGCLISIVFFVVLPLCCTAISPKPTPEPTPTPFVWRIPTTPPISNAPRLAPVPPVRQPQAPSVPEESGAESGAESGKVWVNTDSGVYHYPGQRWYGVTNEGTYMTEQEAIEKGYRANQGH